MYWSFDVSKFWNMGMLQTAFHISAACLKKDSILIEISVKKCMQMSLLCCIYVYVSSLFSVSVSSLNAENFYMNLKISVYLQDLLRTMPSNACFCNITSTGIPRLRRILRGLAWLYPDIGYCQGTGVVGTLVSLKISEYCLFVAAVHLDHKVLPVLLQL